MKNKLITLVLLLLASPFLAFSQSQEITELRFEVNRINPPLSISKEKLIDAQSLLDLNGHYKSSWIKEYISVEVLTNHQGKIKKGVSNNNMLSQEQKNNMNKADLGSDIAVKVRYIPENTLAHNDVKEINFTFTVNPDNDAGYAGGQQALQQYLKANAIDKIPVGTFKKLDLAAVKFTVNESGRIIDAHIFESSKNLVIDEILLETIYKMPNWNAAQYSNGVKVKQQFVLTVGDMDNCVVNLLNINL